MSKGPPMLVAWALIKVFLKLQLTCAIPLYASGMSRLIRNEVQRKKKQLYSYLHSKKGDNDQESIQSSTAPDPGYHMGK